MNPSDFEPELLPPRWPPPMAIPPSLPPPPKPHGYETVLADIERDQRRAYTGIAVYLLFVVAVVAVIAFAVWAR